MKDLVRRFAKTLVSPVRPVRPLWLVRPVPLAVRPYSCVYVAGPAVARRAAGVAA
ncbi:hypothetical protein [Streptomyces sp. PTD5-9]|uniref:hypothetical protein n=1 Tax=Streptomyces sp. PTD5-9 TaxID=3120150 RepID=UPI003008FE20